MVLTVRISNLINKDSKDKLTRSKRYFCGANEIFRFDGRSYVFTNQWSNEDAKKAAKSLRERFPELNIAIEPTK